MPESVGPRQASETPEAPSETPSSARISNSGSPMRVGIPSPGPGPSFRGALASRDFALLWVGQFGSEVGNGLIQLSLPVLVYEITGSAFQLAGAYIVQFLPWLLFGLVGGVLVDRWDRRRTIIVIETVRAAAFLAVGIAYIIDRSILTVEMIYGLIFLESALQNFFNPARLALMPHLVRDNDLRAANSLMEVARHVGFLIMPSAGIALAGVVGYGAIILADGVTFLISGLTVFLIHWRQPPRRLEHTNSWRDRTQQVFLETKQGIDVIRAVRLLQVTVLLGFSLNLVVAPIQGLLPLFVSQVKHQPTAYIGLLAAGFVSGLIIGSLLAPMVSRRIGLGPMAVAGVIVVGGVICAAAYAPTLWIPVIALLIAGSAIGALNVAQVNMLQTSTTDEDRGRVSAAFYTATLGVRPFGYLAAGVLAAPVGVQPLFVAFGIIVLAVGVFLSRVPEVMAHH
jgi:MFS family permease